MGNKKYAASKLYSAIGRRINGIQFHPFPKNGIGLFKVFVFWRSVKETRSQEIDVLLFFGNVFTVYTLPKQMFLIIPEEGWFGEPKFSIAACTCNILDLLRGRLDP